MQQVKKVNKYYQKKNIIKKVHTAFRLTKEQHAFVKARGGSKWIRAIIEKEMIRHGINAG